MVLDETLMNIYSMTKATTMLLLREIKYKEYNSKLPLLLNIHFLKDMGPFLLSFYGRNLQVFVIFQPSLIFVGKKRRLP